MAPYIRATWDVAPDIRIFIEAVHRLSDLGAVVTHIVRGSSQEGFAAEWREIVTMTVAGDQFNRSELFDEADLVDALARFDELSSPAPRLENAASRVDDLLETCFAARDWLAIAEIFADDTTAEDRRQVMSAGVLHGREANIANIQAIVDVGTATVASTVIATRGEQLALSRYRFSEGDLGAEPFHTELLGVIEIDADERIAARVAFDADDFDAAFEELDARYLAGEAAEHAHTWSVIARGFDAVNRREIPATTADFVDIDHRQVAGIGSGDLRAYLTAAFDDLVDNQLYVESVHRLTGLGAVVTHVAKGTSLDGLDVEWRLIDAVTIDGDLINHYEMFDDTDLDAALARFDELIRPAPRLGNAAGELAERFRAHFVARDWDAMAEILTDDIVHDDRRRVVGAGVRRGRHAEIENMRTAADLGSRNMESTIIATRGERLALLRLRFSDEDQAAEAFLLEVLGIVEVNADNRIATHVAFDPNDMDAAFEELDARYLAGEAAPHANTWSLITRNYAAFNRHEFPSAAPGWMTIDHRRGTSFEPGELTAYIRSTWEIAPDTSTYIETVHRVSDLGAVFTQVSKGSSQQGFEAEWREICLLTADGETFSGCELFDEADLDASLARFDELDQPTLRLENAASQVCERFLAHFATGDWGAMAEILADNFCNEDRRRVVGAGVRSGRDAQIVDMRAIADLGITNVTSTVMANRGGRLVLMRVRFSFRDQGPEAFFTDFLGIVEANTDDQIVAFVSFDPDDIDAAFMELDARYLAGEATPHAHTWSAIAGAYAALDRHELPPTAPDWVNVDRQRLALIETGDLFTHVAASWEMLPDWRIRIAALHRLTDFGAVVNWAAEGTSQEGFHAEQRGIAVLTVDGGLINRCELFEDTDLDAALARFDELSQPVPRLENVASRMYVRFNAYLAARDWDAMAEMIADDVCDDDRRRVVSGGIQRGRDAQIANLRAIVSVGVKNIEFVVMATRGERLALCRACVSGGDQRAEAFGLEMLSIIEIDTDDRFAAGISFDVDDIDAAFEELDARYLAGEAAAHSRTWSVIAGAYAALNRHELPATTPGWVNIDRQRLALIEQGDMFAHVRAAWETLPDWHIRVVAVYRLTALGAVATWAATGTSRDGFEAENQGTAVLTVDGDLITGFEMFDAEAVDAALARFDELDRPTPRLENATSHLTERFCAYFGARDWTAMDGILAQNISVDDRRRVVGAGVRHGQEAEIENLQAWADIGIENFMPDVVAIRGRRLALCRARWSGPNQHFQGFQSEALGVVEINADNQIAARSCSTSTTSTPHSRNSMPGTWPVKQPSIPTRGRSLLAPAPRSTNT